jgi:hypothetical protein
MLWTLCAYDVILLGITKLYEALGNTMVTCLFQVAYTLVYYLFTYFVYLVLERFKNLV